MMDALFLRATKLCLGAAMAAAAGACMTFDGMLFSPTPAAADADMLALATSIPHDLRAARHLPTEGDLWVDSALAFHRADDGTPAEHHQTGVLICHGSGGNMADAALWVEALWQRGFTVLVFDYRGYGKSPGRPSEPGLYRDARAARAYLESRTDLVVPERTALYGFSLGAAVAIQLAVEAPAPALVLEAPFASLAAVLADNQPLAAATGWYTDARFASDEKIAQHAGRLLVAVGGADTVTPPGQGRHLAALARAAGREVELFERDHARHCEIPFLGAPARAADDRPPGLVVNPDYVDRVARAVAGPGADLTPWRASPPR